MNGRAMTDSWISLPAKNEVRVRYRRAGTGKPVLILHGWGASIEAVRIIFDELATAELGVDRIFGRGTTPGEVASYLVSALVPAPTTRKKAS